MKSIISDEQCCYVCGAMLNLHRHHILYGTANRKLSEKFGLWVYLCGCHHNLSNHGVHFDRDLDIRLKQTAQKAWERRYGTREEFIKTFGKSYL